MATPTLMNLRSLFKRTIQVPESNETRAVDVPCLWFVRWKSSNSVWVGDKRTEAEVFLTEEEAVSFKESLVKALTLLRYRKASSTQREDGFCPYDITIDAQTQSES